MNNYSIFKEIREDIETLERHMTIIKTLLMEQPLGIIKMSQQTGIPEHKIRYSLRILENEALLKLPERVLFLHLISLEIRTLY